MRKFTTVENVLRGPAPLDRSYTDRNILIGVIDDGIDISHPDFYGEDGKIRISHLWNMDKESPLPPEGYTYGKEWTADSMEYYAEQFKKKKIDIYPMQSLFGFSNHGTPVTSRILQISRLAFSIFQINHLNIPFLMLQAD